MPNRIALFRIERHRETPRPDLANAALDFCRAALRVDGIVEANFYWVLYAGIAIQVEAESPEALDIVVRARGGTLTGALARLQDLGDIIATEWWIHPKDAMFNYYAGQR